MTGILLFAAIAFFVFAREQRPPGMELNPRRTLRRWRPHGTPRRADDGLDGGRGHE